MNGENVKYSYCDNLRKSQCVDKNGNNVPADNLNNNFYNGSTENGENVKPSKQADQKAITRLQAMAMSDDEDFGKNTKWGMVSQTNSPNSVLLFSAHCWTECFWIINLEFTSIFFLPPPHRRPECVRSCIHRWITKASSSRTNWNFLPFWLAGHVSGKVQWNDSLGLLKTSKKKNRKKFLISWMNQHNLVQSETKDFSNNLSVELAASLKY